MTEKPQPIVCYPIQELRPFWSVMIPAYNPSRAYLEQTLRSILDQDLGEKEMQIEVVDDCSPKADVAALVRQIAGERVGVYRSPANKGLAGCWNTCIERSHGEWVHILHQDDYVLPGFYQRLALAAKNHPDVSLLATRSFVVDDEGVIACITERVKELEGGGRMVDRFFYRTPIQCPGVVVKRAFYELNGGFLPSLVCGLDCEMWARVIGSGGGVVVPEALACYRFHPGGESSKLIRSAEILNDIVRMNAIFAERFPAFDVKAGRQRLLNEAMDNANHFVWKGDEKAAENNLNYWKANAPLKQQLRRSVQKWRGPVGKLARVIIGG